mgnify:CR=1 FL=1
MFSYRLGYQDPLNSASSDLRTLGLYRSIMDVETAFSEALNLSVKDESYSRNYWLQRSTQTTREEYLIISLIFVYILLFVMRLAQG